MIDTVTNAVTATIGVGNSQGDSVSVIDAATNTVLTTIDAGAGPVGLALSPDDAIAYVTNSVVNCDRCSPFEDRTEGDESFVAHYLFLNDRATSARHS